MLVLKDNFSKKLEFNTYIALGSFDGIHKGHKKLITETIEKAKEAGSKSMVLTFKDHPLNVINKDIAPKLLMDNERKVEILQEMGVDVVNFINFNKDYMKLSPEEFVKNMIKYYNAKGFIVGFNYRFGYKNLGDISLLKELSYKFKFDLQVVPPVKYNEEIISSSKIRHMIIYDGDVEKASKMLGKNYALKGTIIKGKQLGRKLGFPTVNLDYDKKFVLPRGGVYYTIIKYNKDFYKGITNIGYNPTVEDEKLGVETHILGFHKEIYGESITIYFISRIRDEKKFPDLQGLINQLSKDKEYVIEQKTEINF